MFLRIVTLFKMEHINFFFGFKNALGIWGIIDGHEHNVSWICSVHFVDGSGMSYQKAWDPFVHRTRGTLGIAHDFSCYEQGFVLNFAARPVW